MQVSHENTTLHLFLYDRLVLVVVCWKNDVKYSPSEDVVSHERPSEEADVFACQMRCAKAEGCAYFTFLQVIPKLLLPMAKAFRMVD